LHTNSTVGLCPPTVALDDGGTYRASKYQQWLWAGWLAYIARVKAVANGSPIVAIINGDATDGDHHETSQIISRNEATQAKIAQAVIKPLVDTSTSVLFVRGTESHVGGAAAREEALADDTTNAIRQSDDVASWWHLQVEIGGVTFDVAHHWSRGGLPWTGPNAAVKLAATTIFDYAENGLPPPQLVIRSHMHQWADSYDNYRTCRAICLPAWQVKTAYVHRRPSVKNTDIGGIIVTVDNGAYTVEKFRWEPKKRTDYLKLR
jgi:hypothetical protein